MDAAGDRGRLPLRQFQAVAGDRGVGPRRHDRRRRHAAEGRDRQDAADLLTLLLESRSRSESRRSDDSHVEVSMRICRRLLVTAFLVPVVIILGSSSPARAQVITATLYGVVHDGTGGILPGVAVVVTHQGTNLVRETVSDERGEFALPALPAGPYAIKIELSGFKTYNSQGLNLGAGQTVRQTYALEV